MESASLTLVLLADRSMHENMGRVMHALLYAKQAVGLNVELVFDGGGGLQT